MPATRTSSRRGPTDRLAATTCGLAGLAIAGFLAVALGGGPPRDGAGATARPAAEPPLDQLARAVAEARRNCERARDPALLLGPDRPLFETSALEAALDDNPLITAHARGELGTFREEARWLGRLRPESGLDGRSWEDVRFLLGFVHWYLAAARDHAREERAPGSPSEGGRPHVLDDHDAAALRAFRGMTYLDLLGVWD